MRKFTGVLVLLVGLVMMLLDAHVAYVKQGPAHALNIVSGLLLIFIALWMLMPTVARAFAHELLQIIPALGQLWPGGRRAYDPPPRPDVPLPPSVTKHPDDLTKPPMGGF